jgi:nucleoside-diphosphate-sugar epimerase
VYGYSKVAKFFTEDSQLAPSLKPYDLQKQLIDRFMSATDRQYYGLRFGTVCGNSPVPRNELIINSMTRNAVTKKSVKVSGGKNFRAILGLTDLCNAIDALIASDAPTGFYNMASFSLSITDIAREVGTVFGAEVVDEDAPGSPYSFCLNTDKFTEHTGYVFKDTPTSIALEASKNDFGINRNWRTRL